MSVNKKGGAMGLLLLLRMDSSRHLWIMMLFFKST
jgi:hypothetical protein